ncbi:MAG: site-specific integrase [Acidobacteriota bacterium]|nr:site-specific integrase [Acidobacteriota bacterium]
MSTDIKSLLHRRARQMPRERGSGLGWVRKEAGKWVGRWRDYTMGPPRIRQHKIGPIDQFTERKARQELARHIRDNKPSSEMRFSAAAETYQQVRSGGWGRNQRSTVASVIKNHVLPKLGAMRVCDIKPTHVQNALNELAKTESQSLVKKARTHIGSILEMLVEDETLNRNAAKSATVRRPKTRPVDKATLEVGHLRALLEHATNEEDYLILRILITSGLRPSETFGLRANDIGPNYIQIDEVAMPREAPRKETKSESIKGHTPTTKERSPITPAFARRIDRFAQINEKRQDDFLFATASGRPISHNNWRKRNLQRIATKAGVPHVDFRIIRRSFSTLSQKHGSIKDAQALMRHSDAATTMGIYQQEIPKSVRAMAENWDDELMENDTQKGG